MSGDGTRPVAHGAGETRDADDAAARADDAGTRTGTGLISSRPVYDGRIVDLSIDTVRFPDGSIGDLEMIRHSGAAAVLPVLGPADADDPDILLLRQYRYAADGYMLEVPAGRPDRPGEPWNECARRELEEEAGIIADTLVPLTAIYTTPGFTDERIHLFLGFDIRDGSTMHDQDEFIDTLTLTLSDALGRIDSGEIVDAKTICTLHSAARFLARD